MLAANRIQPAAPAFCFGGCGYKFTRQDLRRFCILTDECTEHIGALCPGCHTAHMITQHPEVKP